MQNRARKVRDPVCGMEVDRNENAIDYQGLHFAFCSRQCKERFLNNPHLYIGYPGHKAPKQEGQSVIKHRRLRLSEPMPGSLARRLEARIEVMMGIKSVAVSGDCIDITYDLLQATEAQVEAEILRAGAALGSGWQERIRRSLVNALEETELDNLEVQPPGGHHHG